MLWDSHQVTTIQEKITNRQLFVWVIYIYTFRVYRVCHIVHNIFCEFMKMFKVKQFFQMAHTCQLEKKELRNMTSVQDGIDYDTECRYRKEAARFLQMCIRDSI